VNLCLFGNFFFLFHSCLSFYFFEAFYGRDKQITAVHTNRLDSPDLPILVDLSSSIFSSKGKLGTCMQQKNPARMVEQIVPAIC
jgi:hypothetical protein